MNTGGHGGRFNGVARFNGGLFFEPARIEIQDLELVALKSAPMPAAPGTAKSRVAANTRLYAGRWPHRLKISATVPGSAFDHPGRTV